ncbi:uncharacterized protein LOC136072068 isoform X2 [Hydra vulgaris]
MLHLKSVHLQLKIFKNAENNFNFILNGKMNNFNVRVEYKLTENPIAYIIVTVKTAKVEDFIKAWGLQSSDLSSFPFENIKDSQISGEFKALYDTKKNHFQLLAQLKYKDEVIDLIGNLVIDKPNGKPIAVALVAKLDNLANIVDYFKTKLNYNGPDFIKELVESGTLSISKQKIDLINSKNFLKLDGKVQRSVEKGIHIYIETDMKTALKNCADKKAPRRRAEVTESNNRNNHLIKISILTTGVVIELPQRFSQDLKILMKCFLKEMNIYVQTVVVPDLLEKSKSPNSFYISELSFLNKEFKMTVAYEGDIDVSFLGLKISNPTFAISKKKNDKKGEEEPWIFKGHSEVISEVLVDASKKGCIDFTFDTNQNFEVNIKIPAMEIKSLARFFKIEPFKGGNERLEKSFSFGINDLYINGKLNIKEKNGELTVTGSPVIQGKTGLKLGLFIWKLKEPQNSNQIGIAFGLVIKDMRLDQTLKKFADVEMSASWLSDISIVLLASNADKKYCKQGSNKKLPECKESSKVSTDQSKKSGDKKVEDKDEEQKSTHFETIDELKEVDVVRGLFLKASVKLKSEATCMGNNICLFLVKKGFTEISLEGEITSSSFKIVASINGKIALSKTLFLESVSLVLKFGSENSISIECDFHLTDPVVVISGFIKIDFCGKLSLGGSMEGMIQKPFGVQWLAIGNINFAFGLDLKTLLPSIEMGAEVWFGKLDGGSQELFKFQGYFGLDASNPKKSYIYFRSSGASLTIGRIAKAFNVKKQFPAEVADSGFIGELIFSMNLDDEEKSIGKLDISVPPGYLFKGKISILRYNIDCDIRINPSGKSFYVKAIFDPMQGWGNGALDLYRDANSHNLGPFLLVDINENKFEVCIRGYIRFHGIKASLDIQINSTHLYFDANGNLFDVLSMNVRVAAQYSKSNGLEHFFFDGCVHAKTIEEVTRAAVEYIEAAQEKVNLVLTKAQNTMEEAKRDIDKVEANIKAWRNKLDRYKNRLEEKRMQLESKRRVMSKSCFDDCGTECVAFFGWMSDCYTIWGRSVGCVTWNKCKWMAPRVACIAACEIGKGLSKFATWAEEVGIKIMQGLTSIGELFSNTVSSILDFAKGIVTLAQNVVEFAKQSTNSILEAIKALVSFRIEHICLSAIFDPKKKTCAGVKLKGSYLNSFTFNFDESICFDTSALKSLGSKAAKAAKPEIDESKIDAIVADVDAKGNDISKECQKVQSQYSKFDKDAKDKTKNIKIPKITSPKKPYTISNEKVRQKINLRNDEADSTMKHTVPWENIDTKEISPMIFQSNASVRHLIPDEESQDFCHQHQNVLSRYSTIADSFSSAFSNINKAKESYMNNKKSYLNEIEHLNDLVHSGPLTNMTLDEQQDILHWRDYTEAHIKSYIDKAAIVFQARKRDSINHVRHTINDAVESDRGLKLPEYIKYLHSLAVKADKKSQINRKVFKDSSISFHHIKEILLNVASDEHIPTLELAKSIDKVQKMLSDVKRSSIPCAA